MPTGGKNERGPGPKARRPNLTPRSCAFLMLSIGRSWRTAQTHSHQSRRAFGDLRHGLRFAKLPSAEVHRQRRYLIDQFKEVDCRGVQHSSLHHRFFEVGRCSEVLSHLCALSIEDDYNLALVAVGGVVDSWVDKACRPLHFDMPIEDGAPLAVVPT